MIPVAIGLSVVGWLFWKEFNPELFSGRKMQVEIDCSEGLNRGMTVCDMRRSAISRPGDVLVLDDVNLPAFQEAILHILAGYDI